MTARRTELEANLKKTQADLSALQKTSTRRRRGTAAWCKARRLSLRLRRKISVTLATLSAPTHHGVDFFLG
jgi:hypothetical protein